MPITRSRRFRAIALPRYEVTTRRNAAGIVHGNRTR